LYNFLPLPTFFLLFSSSVLLYLYSFFLLGISDTDIQISIYTIRFTMLKRHMKDDFDNTKDKTNPYPLKTYTYIISSKTENERHKMLTISFIYAEKNKDEAEKQITS
ncbi:MAG: hypothetical protein ACTSQE_08870, partial [Candidatus Heimdallarchaeaceae archaeon]